MRRCTAPFSRSGLKALLIALSLVGVGTSTAAELVISVSGFTEPLGQAGCALFTNETGFPMDNSGARVQWMPADPKGVTCRYTDVAEGSYAVSVGHDRNGNQRVDTNFFGMPTEQWGVSNNARPSLRAPRFDEAVFKVAADAQEVVVDIKVDK